MGSDEYSRSIPLPCPTCGGTEYEFEGDPQEPTTLLKCTSCERELTRDELISENEGNVQQHASEMKEQIAKDFATKAKKRLQKAFGSNKNFRIK